MGIYIYTRIKQMITVYYCAVQDTQATKLSMGFYRGYSTWFMDVYGELL